MLMLDAQQMMEKQGLTIARPVIEEGCGLVLAVSNPDLLGASAVRVQAGGPAGVV